MALHLRRGGLDDRAQELKQVAEEKQIVASDAQKVLDRARNDLHNATHDLVSHVWDVKPGDLVVTKEDNQIFKFVAFNMLSISDIENRPYIYGMRRRGDGGFDTKLESINGSDWEKVDG